jgi:hypothetical protein
MRKTNVRDDGLFRERRPTLERLAEDEVPN